MMLKRGTRGRERFCHLRVLTPGTLGLGQEDYNLGFEEVILAEPRELIKLAVDILQSQHSSQIVKHDSAFQMAVNIQRFYQVHWMNEGKEEA